MFRWLALVLVLATAPAVFVTLAQQPAPTARRDAIIRVRGASVGAFAAQGDLFAVGVGQQLQFYDLSEPASPRDLATVRLPGRALALGAVDSMMLVAVSRAANADEIVVVAPDPYRRSTPGIVNSLLTSEAIQEIAVAPSGAWAVALNADGYQVLRLTAPDVIESSALIRTADPPLAAALTDDHLLLALSDSTRVDRLPLQLTPGLPTPAGRLTLEHTVTALAVTDDGRLGAAALDNEALVLFDPERMETLASITLEDGPASVMHFTRVGDRDVLLIQINNRSAAMLLDVTDPDDISLPGSAGMGQNSVISLTDAAGSRIALVDDETVALFTLE